MELLERIRDFEVQDEVSPAVYQRGADYYKQRLVKLKFCKPDQISLSVMGGELYTVDFSFARNRFTYDCDCPAYYNWGTCKHIVAADLFVKNSNPALFIPAEDDPVLNIAQILDSGRTHLATNGHEADDVVDRWLLLLSLKAYSWSEFYEPVYMSLDLSHAPQNLTKGKRTNLAQRISDYLAEVPDPGQLLRPLTQHINPAACANTSWPHIHSILKEAKEGRRGSLSNREMESLSKYGIPIFIADEERAIGQPLGWDMEERPIELLIEKVDGGVQFTPKLAGRPICHADGWGDGKRFDHGRRWVLLDDTITRCHLNLSAEQVEVLDELARVHYGAEQENSFFDDYYVSMSHQLTLTGDRFKEVELEPVDPTLQFGILEEIDPKSGEARILLRASFDYAGFAIDWSEALQYRFWRLSDYDPATSVELLQIPRNIPAEIAYLQNFDHRKYRLAKARGLGAGYFKLKRGTNSPEFLLDMVPKLAADGYHLFGEQTLGTNPVNRAEPDLSIDVVSYTDWFDLRPLARFGDVPVALDQLRLAVKQKEQFVVLADGAIGPIPEAWLEKLRPMFGLGEQVDEETVRFGEQQILLIDELLKLADDVSPDQHFSERLAELQTFDGIADVPVSWAFTGELRPYQQAGYNWLHFLRDYGYCGILADDMGLGKTVQVLAFLQACRDLEDDEKPPDLIVMPRSLLFNWAREAEKFTPNLTVMVYYGAKKKQRLEDEYDQVDLIFTTYDSVRNDFEFLSEFEFNTIVLDESQMIKNHRSNRAKAVRELNGRHRLAMTGTPIENTTMELWSQFSFLMPGYLGKTSYFQENFRVPIEKQQNKEVAQTLHNIIRPFVMRRTKEQVAIDLPPCTVKTILLEMEPNQRRLYNRVRDQYRAELLGLIDSGQFERSRLLLISGLTRLRQICLHPKLVQPEYKGESTKFLHLDKSLEELEAKDHRALIFSSFTTALDLVEAGLDQVGYPTLRIDGSTRNREQMVDAFQESDEIPFFLLSLKAAGVGLNLTAADYVILLDPWWNPAAERQAIDRAHRIGQTKPVFVFKLIMKDSIEEKVLKMQQNKQELADQLIQTEESFTKQISAEDIRSLFS